MTAKTFIALCLFVAVPLATSFPYQSQIAQINKANWMSNIPNEQSLALMTIPGTHDSGARDGAWISKCQSMTIADQLSYGLRFLDVRCDVIKNKTFEIHHGIISEHIDFTKVLDPVLQFVTANPSETILMSVKQEQSNAPDSEFIDIFNQYMAAKYQSGTYGDWMYYATGGAVPTLQQIRGKVVVISRVDGLPGIQWSDMDIQDDYDLGDIGTSGKWTSVQNQLNKATQAHDSGSQKMFVNFASGCSYKVRTWAFPYEVAKVINVDLDTYLNTTKCAYGNGCYYGIVPMDFPGKYDTDLVDLLIQQNKNIGF